MYEALNFDDCANVNLIKFASMYIVYIISDGKLLM